MNSSPGDLFATADGGEHLSDKMHSRVNELNGGQRQRVGVTRALTQEPLLLLADEPVASLDLVTARSIMGLLNELNKKGDRRCRSPFSV